MNEAPTQRWGREKKETASNEDQGNPFFSIPYHCLVHKRGTTVIKRGGGTESRYQGKKKCLMETYAKKYLLQSSTPVNNGLQPLLLFPE
jgi:hypothetical protein